MDLLGDIGTADQLTSAREENKILQEKCKELSARVKILTIENESLKAEVEMYRNEVAIPNFSSLGIGRDATTAATANDDNHDDAFIKSGNGVYVKSDGVVTIPNLHDNANILCCSLSNDDVFLATGGADGKVRVTQWGASLRPIHKSDPYDVINNYSNTQQFDAPVISTKFSSYYKNLVAVGCMDGKVHLISYETKTTNQSSSSCVQCYNASAKPSYLTSENRHRKYVKNVAWSPTQPILATASADGTVHVYNVTPKQVNYSNDEVQMMTSQDDIDAMNDSNDTDIDDTLRTKYDVSMIQSLHFPGPVECLTFSVDGTQLICYSRGTPYISFFDITKDFQLTKINLNSIDKSATTGGFSDHVSYTIMDISLLLNTNNCNNNYLACATDTSRNIIIDIRNTNTTKIVRNLFGHKNDTFSQPKIGWSYNGQYIYGNTQDDTTVCIWDIASSKIINYLPSKQEQGQANTNSNTNVNQSNNNSFCGHTSIVRDLFSSNCSDTVVTTSFDKQTKFWFGPL